MTSGADCLVYLHYGGTDNDSIDGGVKAYGVTTATVGADGSVTKQGIKVTRSARHELTITQAAQNTGLDYGETFRIRNGNGQQTDLVVVSTGMREKFSVTDFQFADGETLAVIKPLVATYGALTIEHRVNTDDYLIGDSVEGGYNKYGVTSAGVAGIKIEQLGSTVTEFTGTREEYTELPGEFEWTTGGTKVPTYWGGYVRLFTATREAYDGEYDLSFDDE